MIHSSQRPLFVPTLLVRVRGLHRAHVIVIVNTKGLEHEPAPQPKLAAKLARTSHRWTPAETCRWTHTQVPEDPLRGLQLSDPKARVVCLGSRANAREMQRSWQSGDRERTLCRESRERVDGGLTHFSGPEILESLESYHRLARQGYQAKQKVSTAWLDQ